MKSVDKLSGEEVAIKVVSSFACQCYFDLMNKEVVVLHLIGEHPHLLGVREVYYSRDNIYIVTGAYKPTDIR